jgi:hypothetical protein
MQQQDDDYFDPTIDKDGPTVYVGAQIPLKLYELANREATASMVSRAQVLRWALAERYKAPEDES